MGRLLEVFERCKQENRAALIIYICGGDPNLEVTPKLIEAAANAGADIVELGVPFSDPTADGEAIQLASERALKNGASLQGVLHAAEEARKLTDVPILLFGYFNPIFTYGENELIADAKEKGIDGFLCVDLPPEAAGNFQEKVKNASLDFVPLIAPTTSPERAKIVAELATSFIYYVSLTGVTGSQAPNLEEAGKKAGEFSKALNKPVAVGFGIKTKEDVQQVARQADGAIIGSAVVRVIAEASNTKEAILKVHELVSSLAQGTTRASH